MSEIDPAVQKINEAGVGAIPVVTSSTPPPVPGKREASELPKGLEPTHRGMYSFTDSYLTKAYLVRENGKLHVNIIGTGKVVTLTDGVIRFVMEGGVVE